MFAASLFYGDALITPAISVLSAVEGLSVATPRFENWVVPIAIGLLVGLFLFQRRGTARVGRVFGPVMVLWFLALAALGVHSIVQSPGVLYARRTRSTRWRSLREQPGIALVACGAVFLCVTGAEALYADMGHFGKVPIRVAWYMVAFPALMLNYFGQGALVLRNPEAAKNPFYLLAPELLLLPLVVLATCATIIASQATISAAYSVTQQASRLNFLPRLRVLHTSDTAQGQIYIPLVNWLMLAGVVGAGARLRLLERARRRLRHRGQRRHDHRHGDPAVVVFKMRHGHAPADAGGARCCSSWSRRCSSPPTSPRSTTAAGSRWCWARRSSSCSRPGTAASSCSRRGRRCGRKAAPSACATALSGAVHDPADRRLLQLAPHRLSQRVPAQPQAQHGRARAHDLHDRRVRRCRPTWTMRSGSTSRASTTACGG